MKTTHISKVRQRTETSKAQIEALIGLDDFQYKKLIFDAGIHFIEKLLPNQKPITDPILYDRNFWLWFRMEFGTWNNEIIALIIDFGQANEEEIQEYWWSELDLFLTEKNTINGFRYYLKQFQNIRLA